jgi:hypothetical protein
LLFTSPQIRKTRSSLVGESIEKKKNTELAKTIRPEKNKAVISITQDLPVREKENLNNKSQPKDKKKAKVLSQEIIDQ